MRHRDWLVDDWRNPACDEVPFCRQAERNDRLDVNNILDAVRRANAEVPVVLNRNADEVGDGILRLFFLIAPHSRQRQASPAWRPEFLRGQQVCPELTAFQRSQSD